MEPQKMSFDVVCPPDDGDRMSHWALIHIEGGRVTGVNRVYDSEEGAVERSKAPIVFHGKGVTVAKDPTY